MGNLPQFQLLLPLSSKPTRLWDIRLGLSKPHFCPDSGPLLGSANREQQREIGWLEEAWGQCFESRTGRENEAHWPCWSVSTQLVSLGCGV